MNLRECTDGTSFPWGMLLAALPNALYVRDEGSYLELAFFLLFSAPVVLFPGDDYFFHS